MENNTQLKMSEIISIINDIKSEITRSDNISAQMVNLCQHEYYRLSSFDGWRCCKCGYTIQPSSFIIPGEGMYKEEIVDEIPYHPNYVITERIFYGEKIKEEYYLFLSYLDRLYKYLK